MLERLLHLFTVTRCFKILSIFAAIYSLYKNLEDNMNECIKIIDIFFLLNRIIFVVQHTYLYFFMILYNFVKIIIWIMSWKRIFLIILSLNIQKFKHVYCNLRKIRIASMNNKNYLKNYYNTWQDDILFKYVNYYVIKKVAWCEGRI